MVLDCKKWKVPWECFFFADRQEYIFSSFKPLSLSSKSGIDLESDEESTIFYKSHGPIYIRFVSAHENRMILCRHINWNLLLGIPN